MWSSSKNRLLDPITFISNHSSIHSAGQSPMSEFSATDRRDFLCVNCTSDNMDFLPKRVVTLEELDRRCSALIGVGAHNGASPAATAFDQLLSGGNRVRRRQPDQGRSPSH
jgi:hypothetical protein